jgi:hypothetical protein
MPFLSFSIREWWITDPLLGMLLLLTEWSEEMSDHMVEYTQLLSLIS